ncbi:hypothetical protein THOM_2397 [Trachipleistophora hominis]|uniref:Uncharacterized protein n=1 Tax=Trachipleistophora hominis TaxID=72359 RepID=L7JT98_TRAHO|nr:hypothetical protein THOM_2397 [Trachipleistophora hominis]
MQKRRAKEEKKLNGKLTETIDKNAKVTDVKPNEIIDFSAWLREKKVEPWNLYAMRVARARSILGSFLEYKRFITLEHQKLFGDDTLIFQDVKRKKVWDMNRNVKSIYIDHRHRDDEDTIIHDEVECIKCLEYRLYREIGEEVKDKIRLAFQQIQHYLYCDRSVLYRRLNKPRLDLIMDVRNILIGQIEEFGCAYHGKPENNLANKICQFDDSVEYKENDPPRYRGDKPVITFEEPKGSRYEQSVRIREKGRYCKRLRERLFVNDYKKITGFDYVPRDYPRSKEKYMPVAKCIESCPFIGPLHYMLRRYGWPDENLHFNTLDGYCLENGTRVLDCGCEVVDEGGVDPKYLYSNKSRDEYRKLYEEKEALRRELEELKGKRARFAEPLVTDVKPVLNEEARERFAESLTDVKSVLNEEARERFAESLTDVKSVLNEGAQEKTAQVGRAKDTADSEPYQYLIPTRKEPPTALQMKLGNAILVKRSKEETQKEREFLKKLETMDVYRGNPADYYSTEYNRNELVPPIFHTKCKITEDRGQNGTIQENEERIEDAGKGSKQEESAGRVVPVNEEAIHVDQGPTSFSGRVDSNAAIVSPGMINEEDRIAGVNSQNNLEFGRNANGTGPALVRDGNAGKAEDVHTPVTPKEETPPFLNGNKLGTLPENGISTQEIRKTPESDVHPSNSYQNICNMPALGSKTAQRTVADHDEDHRLLKDTNQPADTGDAKRRLRGYGVNTAGTANLRDVGPLYGTGMSTDRFVSAGVAQPCSAQPLDQINMPESAKADNSFVSNGLHPGEHAASSNVQGNEHALFKNGPLVNDQKVSAIFQPFGLTGNNAQNTTQGLNAPQAQFSNEMHDLRQNAAQQENNDRAHGWNNGLERTNLFGSSTGVQPWDQRSKPEHNLFNTPSGANVPWNHLSKQQAVPSDLKGTQPLITAPFNTPINLFNDSDTHEPNEFTGPTGNNGRMFGSMNESSAGQEVKNGGHQLFQQGVQPVRPLSFYNPGQHTNVQPAFTPSGTAFNYGAPPDFSNGGQFDRNTAPSSVFSLGSGTGNAEDVNEGNKEEPGDGLKRLDHVLKGGFSWSSFEPK